MGGDVKGSDAAVPEYGVIEGADEAVANTGNELRPHGLV